MTTIEHRTIKVTLSPYYLERWSELKSSLDLTEADLLRHLIDTYLITDHQSISYFHQALSKRIRKGIDKPFLTYLTLLSTYLKHFITKTKR